MLDYALELYLDMYAGKARTSSLTKYEEGLQITQNESSLRYKVWRATVLSCTFVDPGRLPGDSFLISLSSRGEPVEQRA